MTNNVEETSPLPNNDIALLELWDVLWSGRVSIGAATLSAIDTVRD